VSQTSPAAPATNGLNDLTKPKAAGRLKRILRRIPFTKAYQERIQERSDEIFNERKSSYAKLKLVDQTLKDKYESEFELGAKQLAETKAWVEEFQSYADKLMVGLFLLTPLVAPVLIARFVLRLPDAQGTGFKWFATEFLMSLITAFLGFIVLFLPAVPASKTSPKLDEFINLTGFFFVWAGVLFLVASYYDYRLYVHRLPFNLSGKSTFYFVNQAGLSIPFLLLVALLYRLGNNAVQRRKKRMHTREVIIDELLSMLKQMDWSIYGLPGSGWSRFWHRETLTTQLETVASCIENNFGRYFPTGANSFNRWTEQTTAEMATGVREVIKWLVESGANTPARLRERVTKYFFAALAGDWGQFDRIPIEASSRREGIRSRIRAVVTALTTAVVPLLLLFVLTRLHILNEPLLTYVTVGAYIWAALSLLSLLDPQYSGKIAALKDLTSILPFAGKKDGRDG
jgi:hypothetical protein